MAFLISTIKKLFNYECRDEIFDMIDNQNIFQYTTTQCGKGPMSPSMPHSIIFYDKNKKRLFTKDDLYCTNCKVVMQSFMRRFILSETSICYKCFMLYILPYFIKKYMILLHIYWNNDIIANITSYFKELHKIKYNYIFPDINDSIKPTVTTVTITTYGSLNYSIFINKYHAIFSKLLNLILPDEINDTNIRLVLRWVTMQIVLIMNETGEYIVIHILPKQTKEIFKEFEKAIQYVENVQQDLTTNYEYIKKI
jgi:hypothetical protein